MTSAELKPENTAAAELFAGLRFDNRFIAELPADPISENGRRQVEALYSRVTPTPVARPQTLAYASEVAELLDLSEADCRSPQFAEVFAGNQLLPGMQPYATCYGGHQFGNWAGQLGDGRAINLGEIVNRRGQRWALQLKGAGPTPYSRSADGLAVLRSSLREFLCSEAMHHLGVPTTRALSLVTTGEQVMRDMFYDGNAALEPGAVVCRVAPSFTRFGHFQLPAARGDTALLKQLADYTLRVDFPHLGEPSADAYLAWFGEVRQRTCAMIIHWMRVGFVHGVMNTDNLSVLGLTIDYGPYGWLEDFDPDWTPNTTDAGGRRYRYSHQPQIALWNLAQLANAILPLFEDADAAAEALRSELDNYAAEFSNGWQAMMAAKLGLGGFDAQRDDETLINDLLGLLTAAETDMTIFFRRLADVDLTALDDYQLPTPLLDAYYTPAQLNDEYRSRALGWLRRYAQRVNTNTDASSRSACAAERRAAMNKVNPKYVLRNYLAQLAIDQAECGDVELLHELLEVLRKPYDEQPAMERHAAKRPDWARDRAGCSMLSCSS